MPRKAFQDMGEVQKHRNGYRAHLQYRDASGMNKNIDGPERRNSAQAEIDLAHIRAAGAVARSREEGLEFMAAEAMRIKVTARYQLNIRETVHRLASQQEEQDDECWHPDSDNEPEEDEPWMRDYEEMQQPDISPTPPSQQLAMTPLEATAVLHQKFRPVAAKPTDLEHLLACHADPNYPVEVGNISPLRHVILFAQEEHVEKMRALLLQYGAKQSEEDLKRWELRQRADLCERIRLREARDLQCRVYDPCAATHELNM